MVDGVSKVGNCDGAGICVVIPTVEQPTTPTNPAIQCADQPVLWSSSGNNAYPGVLNWYCIQTSQGNTGCQGKCEARGFVGRDDTNKAILACNYRKTDIYESATWSVASGGCKLDKLLSPTRMPATAAVTSPSPTLNPDIVNWHGSALALGILSQLSYYGSLDPSVRKLLIDLGISGSIDQPAASFVQASGIIRTFGTFFIYNEQAWVFATDQDIIITVRGSGSSSLAEIIEDWIAINAAVLDQSNIINYAEGLWPGNLVVVHRGFLDYMNTILPDVVSRVASYANEKPSRSRLWLTGHSLGGAVATMLAAHIKEACKSPPVAYVALCRLQMAGVVTFDAPRPGASGFMDYYNDELGLADITVTYVNENDVVPFVPPGFSQVGHRIDLFTTQEQDGRQVRHAELRGLWSYADGFQEKVGITGHSLNNILPVLAGLADRACKDYYNVHFRQLDTYTGPAINPDVPSACPDIDSILAVVV